MTSMFADNSDFNQNISTWNTSNVTNMSVMFSGATTFNQNIGSWDVSKVTNMEFMFRSASAFNQNIGSWDVEAVTNLRFILNGTALSTPNYDALLIGWDALELQNNLFFLALVLLNIALALALLLEPILSQQIIGFFFRMAVLLIQFYLPQRQLMVQLELP